MSEPIMEMYQQPLQTIIKRDGSVVPFDSSKILNAITKAAHKVSTQSDEKMTATDILFITEKVVQSLTKSRTDTVEGIQDVVEETLIKYDYPKTAKEYILYRSERSKIRNSTDYLMDTFKKLTFVKADDLDNKRENANINADTAMGTMLKYGTESSNYFIDNYVLPKEIAAAHISGDIHIHKSHCGLTL